MRRRYLFMAFAFVVSGLAIGGMEARLELTSTETFLLASIVATAICLTGLHGVAHRSR